MASPKVTSILAHPSTSTQTIESLIAVCPSCHHEVLVDALCECFICGGVFCGKASNDCKARCLCDLYGEPYDDDTRHEVLRSLGLDESADDKTIVKAIEQATKNELENNRKKKLEAVRQTKKRFAFDA